MRGLARAVLPGRREELAGHPPRERRLTQRPELLSERLAKAASP